MINFVIKRDGRLEEYDSKKITDAISKGFKSVGCYSEDLSKKITVMVEKRLNELNKKNISIEDIQNNVEDILIEQNFVQIAKNYIKYREKRRESRSMTSAIDVSKQIIDKYIENSHWKIKENANRSFSLQGLNCCIVSDIVSTYWLEKVYPEEIGKAHMNGDLHIHDLSSLSTYCMGWDLKDFLKMGFGGIRGKIESNPPKHLRTALGQLVNLLFTLQHESAGAQAVSSFDTYLAPFVRYDNLSYKDVKQAIQEFVYNMNVPTRVGFETPFTNVTMDLTIPKNVGAEKVVYGGKELDDTYSQFQDEVNLINKAFCEVMMEGDAKGRIFTFPIPTYNISKNFDWDNPMIDDVMAITSKYGIPYFANYVNSDMDPEDARSMCCRLRLDNRELRKRGGGLFGANPLTGSIGVVTINLPRIAYLSNTKEEFYERLDYLMSLAKDSLEIKRKVISQLMDLDLYPYSKRYLKQIYDVSGSYWSNHFSTIGLIGMNEACLNLFGEPIYTEKGMDFSKEVMDHMRDEIVKFQEETGNMYNLEATPAEGTTFRLAKLDKEKYGDIIVANEKNYRSLKVAPYYTNSSQLPVTYTNDIFKALKLQDQLQVKYTGGTVHHIYLGESLPDLGSLKLLIKKICENHELPYFTISPIFSICPIHGYISGAHEYCPICAESDDEELEQKAVERKLELKF